MITYAIGDIHGCFDELQELILRIQDYHTQNHSSQKMKFVFIGDYIDRGPDTKAVINFLIDFEGVEDCVFLRGNHEDMFLNDLGLCFYNGGYQTIASYGWNSMQQDPRTWTAEHFPKEHRDFMRRTKLYHKDSLRTYVHAGINRSNGGIENQSESAMLWIREQFLRDDGMEGGYVVHGHTPIGIESKPNRCNVDAACVFGGYLAAAVFNDHEVEPIHFVTSDHHDKGMKGPL